MSTRAHSDCNDGRTGTCAAPANLPLVLSRNVAGLQAVTIVWMVLECGGSLWSAAHAHSVALLAFGSDSLIELLSAAVVLLQFSPTFPLKRKHAERTAAVLLFALAGVVTGIAAFAFHKPVETSVLGIAVTSAALILMPLLAWLKRRQAQATGNRALAADATQSATCAYLAAMTLAGLAAYAWWHIAWVDSVAALAAVPILIVEGRRTWRGEGCSCGS